MNTSKDSTTHLGFDISKLKFIGQGQQGKVYMLPGRRVIKVFYKRASCKSQLEILLAGQGSRFFPSVFDYDRYSIIMSFVEGIPLCDYLVHEKLDKTLSLELVRLIEEFRHLQFTRLDMRINHIFVQADKTIKIIDPRGSFRIVQPYPLLMMKGLQENGVLDDFLNGIKNEYPFYYNYWKDKMFKPNLLL